MGEESLGLSLTPPLPLSALELQPQCSGWVLGAWPSGWFLMPDPVVFPEFRGMNNVNWLTIPAESIRKSDFTSVVHFNSRMA